ncbi:hypothetical protein CONCODRAFT_76837 [Conidiobolus coronatus NRRL 28638]|uniref:Pre-mRNA-splicing factor SLT11 n=1 Tax=Conidiobolus coronatus (strain ATCC 28846 / CBS 209.66 / NRRL 28638) TaxID=796925 RepID=A0A137PHG0_CONC2|nr:hypothetical protein CONCODRAFT_76837 [Conidiobolus coronatus NRRL 28638]|eukprot:KXN74439.1 hypothetical protein CONCODRAFT_76837 [Conidiobolus coronatus NRRL 28638]
MAKVEDNKIQWETSDFPILCESCLGDNPYVRMIKEQYGNECKICTRPFTVFRWNPGQNSRFKKTEICTTCARVKNVCQTCILDLQFNLPVGVRDAGLDVQTAVPNSNINKEYYIQNAERAIKNGENVYDFEQASESSKALLRKLARPAPYYKRNQAHICSFFVRGNCNRGTSCPYRHEIPEEPNYPRQNIKDRYHGTNDPVAKKILDRAANVPTLTPPKDRTITSLFATQLHPETSQEDLKEFFNKFGAIKSVVLVTKAKAAFINFSSREAAEAAAENSNNVVIRETLINVVWGRPKTQAPKNEIQSSSAQPSAPSNKPPPPPGTIGQDLYPSQDPTLQGSKHE